jgi:O-acetyl-ADP-ribose deacetylase (regulator of RNase III)
MSQVHYAYTFPSGLVIEIAEGDLTSEPLDAIVNAANAYLQHGGGVAGAIVREGGVTIQEESDAWVRKRGPVTFGHPAVTGPGSLPCRYIIHAVGPRWGEGDEEYKLIAAVKGSLSVAEELQLTSLALPAISTGIFGFPRQRAAGVILGAIQAWCGGHLQSHLKLVRLTLLDYSAVVDFLAVAHELFA